jgi:hypothetical protein
LVDALLLEGASKKGNGAEDVLSNLCDFNAEVVGFFLGATI